MTEPGTRTLPTASPLAHHWNLDPTTVFLNHGSFGACPRSVIQAQAAWRAQMEAEPVRFFVKELPEALDRSRKALAPIIGAQPGDLAPLANATTAVATVLDNLDLSPGDEILLNTHEYNACVSNCRRAAERSGARVVTVDLPWPVTDEDQVVEAIMAGVTSRTRVCLLSGVTSPSAIVMPIEKIAAELHAKDINIILDAAHGPGCVPLDLRALGVAYATGNCHKWLCAPKGSAFLYVREDLQQNFRPLVLSNASFGDLEAAAAKANRSVFHTEFDYCGTTDPTALLTIADSVEAMNTLDPDGLDGVRRSNRAKVLEGRRVLCEALGVEPPVPESMIGPMAAIMLPPHSAKLHERLMARPTINHDALWETLQENWGIQVPVHPVPFTPGNAQPRTRRAVRLSAQLYNSPEQYTYLAEALSTELARERDFTG